MVPPLVVGERHGVAELTDQREPLGEREGLVLLCEIAIEAEPVRVMLEDKCRALFGVAVVEDALDALMLHSFQHTEFALGGAGEALPGFG